MHVFMYKGHKHSTHVHPNIYGTEGSRDDENRVYQKGLEDGYRQSQTNLDRHSEGHNEQQGE